NISTAISYLRTTDPTAVTLKELSGVSDYVGTYLRIPVILILSVLAVWLYSSNLNLHFRKVHSMNSLREQEQKTWPLITPVTSLNLVEQDINKGPWASALTPIEFCYKHQLLEKPTKPVEIELCVAKLKSSVAKGLFILQLGPYWQGIEALCDHTLALFAVFAAHMNFDTKGAAKLLKQMNASVATGKLDFSGAKELLDKYKDTDAVQKIVRNHAYLLTIMASLLERSRHSGVLPCSEFLWLKPVDRRLWYILNNVGRYTAFSEVAGLYAHWLAEKSLERAMVVPMVDEAVTALEIAVSEVKLSSEALVEL
ncbi:MAG: type IVB secretion system coupling complex protein DotM/IcmP, partial [Gammaproteobacteria bacterium]